MQQLKGLGTWTSESETMVGRSVLSESILDPLLLQDIVPPLPSQPLLDIVSKQFEALQLNKASSEAKVQALFSRSEDTTIAALSCCCQLTLLLYLFLQFIQ